MKLIIVESPNKARKIQEYLGTEYVVMASMGHICDLMKTGAYGLGVDIANGFKPSYSIMKDKISLLDEMIAAAEKAEVILLASDFDREGESIAAHLRRYLISANKPIKRIVFNEITKSALLKAIENPKDINDKLFRSQESRRILDRIVGFMVSSMLLNHYGPNLSAGRVQSVAVRMIADREKEIEDFIPDEFWNLSAKFKTKNQNEFTAKLQQKPKNKDAADALIAQLKNQEFIVSSIVSQKKKERPCAPMTTASLQQYMAKKFSFEPEHTMKIAQNLYENGYCTYIRTDSTRISDEALEPVRSWLLEHSFQIPKTANTYSAKSTAQDAHECIRPTNIKTHPEDCILAGDDKKVYDAIWKHFVACQMNPAIWNTMQVVISCRSIPKLKFTVSGKALDYNGYLEIFGEVDAGSIDIPNLTEQEVLMLSGNIKAEQKFTQHPPRFNDATILKELEDKQIGRPATYAEIIKKISHRNYVEKTGNTYKPTELGKRITNILVNLFPFMEYEYTSELEKKLDEIADGNIEAVNMLKEFFVPFKDKLDQAYMDKGGIRCDLCKNPMIKRLSKSGNEFLGCLAFPKCYHTQNSPSSKTISS